MMIGGGKTTTLKPAGDLYDLVIRSVKWLEKHFVKEYHGGYLTVMDDEGQIILYFRVRKPSSKDWKKLLDASHLHAARLFQNPRHVSSFQSKIRGSDKIASAIRAGDLILAFSGFDGLVNEAVVICLGYLLFWLDREKLEEIVAISQNPYVESLTDSLI